jgi:hypothetical protein
MKTYPDKTRYVFIQLRARGVSLGVISTQIDVPKSTLGDWDKSFADEIARLRAIEWEAVEEQFGRTLEKDLCAMAERIRKWEARIDRMNPDHFKVREVLAVLRETRREYFRRRAILMAPLENTLTRAVSRSLSRRPDESGRYTFLPPTPLHNANDLQQQPTQPSGDGARPSPAAATPDQPQPVADSLTTGINEQTSTAIPSPGGEGKGEGDSAVARVIVKFCAPAQPAQQPVGVPSSDGSSPALDESQAKSKLFDFPGVHISSSVTPDVRRGLTSPETLDSTSMKES